jgi:hypothetical protein
LSEVWLVISKLSSINPYQPISLHIRPHQSVPTHINHINSYHSISVRINPYQLISTHFTPNHSITILINPYQPITLHSTSLRINPYQSFSIHINTHINPFHSKSLRINPYQPISIHINRLITRGPNLCLIWRKPIAEVKLLSAREALNLKARAAKGVGYLFVTPTMAGKQPNSRGDMIGTWLGYILDYIGIHCRAVYNLVMGIYWDIWVEQLPSFDLIVQAAQVVINMRFLHMCQ